MSIRLKLSLVLALAVAIATAAASSVFISRQKRSLQLAEEEKIHLLLDNVKTMSQESLLAHDPLMLIDYLSFISRDREEVLRARARIDGKWQGPEPQPLSHQEIIRSETVIVPAAQGNPEILVEVAFSRNILDARLQAAQKAMAKDLSTAAGIVMFFGMLLSIPLSWSLTKRLISIERAMKDIGEGKLDRPIASSGSDEVAKLARGLNAMAAKLKEVDELKRTFVASVTHELRSPLFSIESYVKMLLRESTNLGAEEKRQLLRIEENAVRLAHFVTSLLDMARIERGKLDYRPRPTEIARLIEDASLFHKSRATEQNKTISFNAEHDLPTIKVDPDLINQVVTNLVANAIKFTRPGGKIEVLVRRDNTMLVCSVSDTGVGISKETLARLFRPFERGLDPMRAGGTGLGLSIAKAIIERHQGKIWAESELGKGSRFYFSIPLVDNKSLTQKRS